MLFIGIFNVAIYYFRSKEEINLFFGLMCIFHFTRYSLGMMEMDSFLFPNVNENIKYIGSGISLYLIIYYLARFALCLLRLDKPLFVKILKITTALAVLFTLVTPYSVFFMNIVIFASRLVPVLVIAYLTYHLLASVKRLIQDIRFVFVFAYFVYVLMVLIEIKGSILFRLPSLPAGLILIAAQCIVLAHAYGNALATVEKSNDILEETVAERTKELQKANETTQSMIVNISHDLRTPIAAVNGYMELLLSENGLDETGRQYVENAFVRVRQMQKLTEDLFMLSQLADNTLSLSLEPLNLYSALRECVNQYGVLAEQKGVTLTLAAEQNGTKVIADKMRLLQTLDNLMQNALYFAKTNIHISAKEQGKSVRITVTDDGPGLAPGDIPLVFDRFYKKRKNGSGLSLSIVKELVKRMGGEVFVESMPFQATSFSFTLICQEEN